MDNIYLRHFLQRYNQLPDSSGVPIRRFNVDLKDRQTLKRYTQNDWRFFMALSILYDVSYAFCCISCCNFYNWMHIRGRSIGPETEKAEEGDDSKTMVHHTENDWAVWNRRGNGGDGNPWTNWPTYELRCCSSCSLGRSISSSSKGQLQRLNMLTHSCGNFATRAF